MTLSVTGAPGTFQVIRVTSAREFAVKIRAGDEPFSADASVRGHTAGTNAAVSASEAAPHALLDRTRLAMMRPLGVNQ